MFWLIFGVLLWSLAHLFKRLAPRQRRKMGDAAKGMVAGASVVAIVLMVIGYKMADTNVLWQFGSWAKGVNNLLVLIGFILLGAGMGKGTLKSRIRHPMLTGFSLWAVAHLLVNGDTASVVLFGGLLIWALLDIVLINRAEPKWTPPKPGKLVGDLRTVAIGTAIYAVVGGIHMWIGPNPFGG